MRRTDSIAIAVLIVALGGPTLRAEETFRPSDCGLKSLWLVLRLSHRPANLGRIERALPARSQAGYSLAELAQASRACGLRVRGMRFGAGDVPLDRPAIAYLRGPTEGHFVVLRPVGVTGTMVQLIDPPDDPRIIDYEELLSRPDWTGRILVPQTMGEVLRPWAWFLAILLLPFGFKAVRRKANRR
jgi:ABC-type bacteriocin/lantibiotic exporter with double-glycine peptidase domain